VTSLLGGRFSVDESLAGSWEWGLHAGTAADGRRVLIATTAPHGEPTEAIAARLGEGRGALLAVEREQMGERPVDVLVEVRPEGEPIAGMLDEADATRLVGEAVGSIEALHATGLVVGSLRPELIFVDGGGRLSGLAPFSELFFRGIAPLSTGLRYPFDDLYMAPELVRGAAPEPASDVFCLAASFLRWRLGRYPFPGDSFLERIRALASGRLRAEVGALTLPPAIRQALAPHPRQRPPLAALRP
jgi:serine/threonine protein kinase